MSYKQKPIAEEPLPLTERISLLKAAYDSKGLIYIETAEDNQEKEFMDLVSRRPDTHRKYITSIYRLKTQKRFVVDGISDEVLIYHMKEEVMNHVDEYKALDRYKGFWWNVETRLNKNAAGKAANVQVLHEYPVFQIPFSPEKVDEILSWSIVDVNQFYVAHASNKNPNITTGDIYAIKNREDFKFGKFDELMDMGRYNYSTQESRLADWRSEGGSIKKQTQTLSSLTGNQQVPTRVSTRAAAQTQTT